MVDGSLYLQLAVVCLSLILAGKIAHPKMAEGHCNVELGSGSKQKQPIGLRKPP